MTAANLRVEQLSQSPDNEAYYLLLRDMIVG